MFTRDLTLFLQELALNNSKTWMDANRGRYEKLRDEFLELIQAVLFSMAPFEPALARLDPKQCMYRINRDIRFSKNKTPYKTYFSAAMSEYGRKTADPAYYLHIDESGTLHIDAGLTSPEPKEIEAMRQLIFTKPEEFDGILHAESFQELFEGKIHGEKLKTVPRGYPADNPHIEVLKLKSFLAYHQTDAIELTDKELPQYITAVNKELRPFVEFCRRAVKQARK
jgi:uncharacterized protein (TIGR02453 family)